MYSGTEVAALLLPVNRRPSVAHKKPCAHLPTLSLSLPLPNSSCPTLVTSTSTPLTTQPQSHARWDGGVAARGMHEFKPVHAKGVGKFSAKWVAQPIRLVMVSVSTGECIERFVGLEMIREQTYLSNVHCQLLSVSRRFLRANTYLSTIILLSSTNYPRNILYCRDRPL